MEKRLQFILSAVLIALAGLNGHGQSQIFSAEGYYYEITSPTSTPPQVRFIGRDDGLGTEVTIPPTVNHDGTDYDVTAIRERAFSDDQLTRVTFTDTPGTPSKLTSIGNFAFQKNQLQGHLEIPDSVESIGDRAFQFNRLTEVTIGDNVTSIGYATFGDNQLQGHLEIPDSVESIGDFAFAENQLIEVTIGDNVTSIGYATFGDNQLQGHLEIPDSVESIGGFAFAENQLKSVTFTDTPGTPSKLTSIGDNAFAHNKLEEVTIPGSVDSIGNWAFTENQLDSATIGNGVTRIGDGVFAHNKLTGVAIPDGVTDIEIGAFANNQLTEVAIPDGVTDIGNSAFQNNQLTEVAIPNSVISIGTSAFFDNELDSVTIGNGVTSIGGWAFANNKLAHVAIPDGVISIGNRAFLDNELDSVTIGNSVASIGTAAFADNQLESVTIPHGVTSIGNSAFGDNQLESVDIPDSVTRIGHWAFAYNRLDSVTIGNSVESIETNAFANNQLERVAIPDGITDIGDNTFQNNDLSSVVIPNSVASIGRWALGDNPYLGMMTVEADDPPALDADAFAGLYDNDTNLRGQIHLIVPPGRVQVYSMNDEWEGFKTISDGSGLPLPTIGAPQSVGGLGPFTVDISFDGGVTGLGLDDIEVTHATVSTLTGSGSTYTASLEPTSLCDGASITIAIPVNVAESTATGLPNQAAEQAVVAVVDAIAPTIACPADVVADAAGDGTGDCTATVALGSPVTDDNCSVATVVIQVNGTEIDPDTYAFGIGTTTVTWTVSDGSGNTASCQQTVTVEVPLDNLVAMARDITVQLEANGQATISPDMVDNGSNYGCNNTPELSLDMTTFDCDDVGTPVTVVLTAAQGGETATATAVVTVEEYLDNLVAMARDITVQLEANGQATISPDMVDNGSTYGCNGTPELNLDIDTFDCGDVGTVTVVLTAAQGNNSATATALVTVEANGNCELGPLADFNRGFSPNGDGIADTLVIEGLERYRNNIVKIYNLGQRLLFSAHYGGPGDAWDGTDERGLVPVGSYVCVIDYNEPGLGHEAKMIYVNY